jgi:hypothetical protein
MTFLSSYDVALRALERAQARIQNGKVALCTLEVQQLNCDLTSQELKHGTNHAEKRKPDGLHASVGQGTYRLCQ